MALVAIVDDRVTNRNIFSKLAASIAPDIQVHSFGNPREALDWLAENPVDLVITDYKMPEMNGADFVRALRTLKGLLGGDLELLPEIQRGCLVRHCAGQIG